ncbi:transposable element Tc3 transposase [Trichonephila clavipes]|nr:transposable element Tc3 transposase [Trichonephila clavipes]
MLGSRTDLHIFDAGSVNGTRYCNEILLPYVRLLEALWVCSLRGRQCTMSSHSSCEQLLESEDIERMDCRHDLRISIPSSMYNGDFLGRRLAARILPQVTIRASIGAARRMGSNASTTH